MQVARLEGKYKLSQNRSAAEQERVAHALLERSDGAEQGVGQAMLYGLVERAG
jgi:predicted FMN-binding regulatory protein PaiB